MQRISAPILLALLTCAGCVGRPDTPRAACVAKALVQPGLENGVAVFSNGHDGLEVAARNFSGWWQLRTGYRYKAASLTKPRLAHVIRRSVEVGELSLDARVTDLLPEYVFSGAGTTGITLRHLLQHTAGLGQPGGWDPLWYRGDETKADCESAGHYILQFAVESHPGEATKYSNAGYCLLSEVVRRVPQLAGDPIQEVLRSDLGGAGGWRAPLLEIHAGLARTLPTTRLPQPPGTLPDGSWYSWGWRYWPERHAGAPWTHTGRLPGILAVALSDGQQTLLVAHFDGDPEDYHEAAARFGQAAWPCMTE